MQLHPTTRILLGLSLIVASSVLGLSILLAVTALLSLGLVYLGDLVAWRWVRRARWLLIVSPLISGYVITGDGVIPVLDLWSPTWQGLALGLTQSLRLLVALLGLRLLLRPLSREDTTLGLTTLLLPFSYIGVDVLPFARRLALTLTYLEHLDGKNAVALLRGALPTRAVPFFVDDFRVIPETRLGFQDGVAIVFMLAVLIGVLS